MYGNADMTQYMFKTIFELESFYLPEKSFKGIRLKNTLLEDEKFTGIMNRIIMDLQRIDSIGDGLGTFMPMIT